MKNQPHFMYILLPMLLHSISMHQTIILTIQVANTQKRSGFISFSHFLFYYSSYYVWSDRSKIMIVSHICSEALSLASNKVACPYRNFKLLTRVWQPCDQVATTCPQPYNNFGFENVSTLWQPCSNLSGKSWNGVL